MIKYDRIIYKEFEIDFAHQLPNYEGQCNKLHGHRGKLIIGLKGNIDPNTGMIIDFVKFDKIIKEHIIKILDHNFMNDIIPNPTAENITEWICNKLMFDIDLCSCTLYSIKFCETPTSCYELIISLKE